METAYDAYHLVFDNQKKGQFYLGWRVKDTYVQTPVTVKEQYNNEKADELVSTFSKMDTFHQKEVLAQLTRIFGDKEE